MQVKQQSEREFLVALNSTTFTVTVDEDYYQKLTGGNFSKEHLIKASFKFLLDREPKESILRSFNLNVIQRYFPEYLEKIKEYLSP